MKISINDQVDALYLTFNNNKVAETIQLELEINADVDSNNKVVGLEVLHYSKLRHWTNNLLESAGISHLLEDIVVFHMHHGYTVAWFYKQQITIANCTPCRCYVEGENIQYDTVENYIQTKVDFIIKHR